MFNDVYVTQSLFPDSLFETATSDTKQRRRKKEQALLKKNRNFGLENCSSAVFCGQYGIPLIKTYTGEWPGRLVPFSELKGHGDQKIGVATFEYDYLLDRLVYFPDKYAKLLSTYKCVCEPDLSIKIGNPLAVAVANTFRGHSVSYCLQEHGCRILPTMKWAAPNTFDVCFSGYGKGGAVIVSTIGIRRDERSKMYFLYGFQEMLRRISPDSVGFYGDCVEWIDKMLPEQLDVRYFPHERFNRMRGYGRTRCI